MLLMMLSSCNPPTIKGPVKMYAINTSKSFAAKGVKNLNYKSRKNKVGEWIRPTEEISLNRAPTNMMCFSMRTWLKTVKPTLKKASDYYKDYSK